MAANAETSGTAVRNAGYRRERRPTASEQLKHPPELVNNNCSNTDLSLLIGGFLG